MGYSKQKIKSINELKKLGLSGREIAKELSLSKSSVNYALAGLGHEGYSSRRPKNPVTLAKTGAKILMFDLESTPSITATFGRFKVNVGLDAVIEEGGWLLSIAWKFLGEDKVHSAALTPEEAISRDDSRLVAILYELFEEADFVMAHNLLQFDLPLFKTRLIVNFFPPAKTVKPIDTLQIAKKLKFNSNRLNGLAQELGLTKKVENDGMPLWLGCMRGEQKHLDKMQAYNEGDIVTLEQVYLALRAFDAKSPSQALYHDDDKVRCGVCGSEDVEHTGHSVYTAASEFKEIKCNSCGKRSRTRTNLMSQLKRKTLLSNIM
jgi:hypothetical protein